MNKVEIIDNSTEIECKNQHDLFKTCEMCNGTGKYKREKYILVANNLAFDVDQAGK